MQVSSTSASRSEEWGNVARVARFVLWYLRHVHLTLSAQPFELAAMWGEYGRVQPEARWSQCVSSQVSPPLTMATRVNVSQCNTRLQCTACNTKVMCNTEEECRYTSLSLCRNLRSDWLEWNM